jgi:hypothetical protein
MRQGATAPIVNESSISENSPSAPFSHFDLSSDLFHLMKNYLRFKFLASALLGVVGFLGATALSHAQGFRVSIATSALNLPANNANAPFSLDFQLNSGSTLNNNSVSISNFNFSGGSGFGPATFIGGASGSLLGSVTLSDTGAFNEFFQTFTVGSSLSFDFTLTRKADAGPTPDAFSIAILDGNLFNVPTTGLGDSLLLVNINGSTSTGVGTGSYQGVTLSITPVPEPATYGVVSVAVLLAGVATTRAWRRRVTKAVAI